MGGVFQQRDYCITPFGHAVVVYKASPSGLGLVNQQQHSKRCNNYYMTRAYSSV